MVPRHCPHTVRVSCVPPPPTALSLCVATALRSLSLCLVSACMPLRACAYVYVCPCVLARPATSRTSERRHQREPRSRGHDLFNMAAKADQDSTAWAYT
jgi:hypothetical protein